VAATKKTEKPSRARTDARTFGLCFAPEGIWHFLLASFHDRKKFRPRRRQHASYHHNKGPATGIQHNHFYNPTRMTDQFGGTPLPPIPQNTPLKVWYDPSCNLGEPQQPHAQQVAAFEAVPNDDCINGSVLDLNQHFLVYGVKNGLLRVLHRGSSVRSLLRGHTAKVTDIAFFQNGDVLGTVGGNLIIWRIFYRSPDILSEKLLEIPNTLPNMSRLVWHPFNPNQFWLLYHGHAAATVVATLVETTRITTVTQEEESHAICQLYNDNVVMDGAVLIQEQSSMTDLSWSGKDTRHVLTSHEDGTIRLWDTKKLGDNQDGLSPASCVVTLQEEEAVTRCMFISHDNIAREQEEDGMTSAFLTATRGNSVITLWSAFYETRTPTKLQVFGLQDSSPSYNLSLCFGQSPLDKSPPAFFILLSDRNDGKVYILHMNTVWSTRPPKRVLMVGLDYIVPFSTKYPIYSWSITGVPAQAVGDEETLSGSFNYDISMFCYQSKMVQHYTLPHYMCLPPSNPWSSDTPGVQVESMSPPVSTVEMISSYDEDYELEEVDDDEEEDYEAPAASSLPTPDGLDAKVDTTTYPFANWLGAIAAKTTGAAGSVPPPPTPATSTSSANISSEISKAAPLPSMEPAFLNPAELLSGSMR